MRDVITQTEQLQRQGMRRLMVISGEGEWCQQQAQQWLSLLPGDWLWLGDAPQSPLHCAPEAVRTLLGQEFLHAVFDARHGFNAEALAVLAGTLKAGSWLLMLVPEWAGWPTQPDKDSLRWGDTATPLATPNFVSRLQKLLLADPQAARFCQHQAPVLPAPPFAPDWQPDDDGQQQALLEQLLMAKPGIYVVTAPRGRGKSALAGLLAARWPGRALISAPAKAATDVLATYAGDAFDFIAPDRLLALDPAARPRDVDWLLIDEAAAIPAPMLEQLVRLFPRTLLTTTLQGYEGTGRGFMLKFCDSLPNATLCRLDQPLRWSAHDPLEQFIDRALLFSEAEPEIVSAPVRFCFPQQAEWQENPAVLEAIYQLLASAHYRTSPIDLRRMMDAPGMRFSAALQADKVQGALWLVEEGGLTAELAQAVWAGLRRPPGNLVAQSLAAHGGWPEAAQMRSRRISRIAIMPALRRQGVGREMVRHSVSQAEGLDFFSVSFGYTPSLWRFWQACGFRLARVGTRTEASSGCHTAMAILPLSERGRALADRAERRLARDWRWLRPFLHDVDLTFPNVEATGLDEDDWRELAGFAWAQRSFEAAIGELGRLLENAPQPLPLLQGALTEGLAQAELVKLSGLSGRKALLNGWRQEAERALTALDNERAETWRLKIMKTGQSDIN
ncbi:MULTISPECIES: tRNA(Met) cytidine acetyltransferase TmcA [Erwinia]|uniref:tRNA(Met) cytidine acetyltransferase TmcA n=1 Tax=Erwinia persicina TaxID=55211 RepID=UPI003F59F77D